MIFHLENLKAQAFIGSLYVIVHMIEKGTTELVLSSMNSKHDGLSWVIGIEMYSLTMETSSELLNIC